MQLQDLIQDQALRLARGDAATPILDLTDDSRQARPGSLFMARGGTRADGRSFIADAVARGAVAVIADREPVAGDPEVAWTVTERVDQSLAGRLAERFFDHPSRRLKLIGVTGTNGKTTIAFVVQHLLHRIGIKCGIIGTVVLDDGQQRQPAELTTPGAIDISRHLAAMVRNGCQAAVMEVSSHALHQGRTAALRFDVGVFSNLTGDHLDYHGTMEQYADAKALLFDQLAPGAWAVVNRDDPWTVRMLRDTAARPIYCNLNTSGGCGGDADAEDDASRSAGEHRVCSATILALGPDHSIVRFEGMWGGVEVRLPLVGRHNVMNVLEALAAANCVQTVARGLSAALETCPAPAGRLEPVRIPHSEFRVPSSRTSASEFCNAERGTRKAELPAVLVDYAHTHDALENVLAALRPVTEGQLIVLFGCGGDRDRTKRPRMAAVACRLADRVVITSDNPRTEDPGAIIREILTGVPTGLPIANCQSPIGNWKLEIGNAPVLVQPDRAAAIQIAIDLAGPDDVVLLAGKGHEDYQIIGATKRHFDDREQAAEALRRRAQQPPMVSAS